MQELLLAQWYVNSIFYLGFRKELILIEANFAHLLHYPHFLLGFIKKKSLPPTEFAL